MGVANPIIGQPVQIRRFNLAAEAADVRISQVGGEDNDYIGPVISK